MLLLRKLWSRKKPAPTIAYVAIKLGQRKTRKAQIAMTIEIARRVEGERGKKSAKITPVVASNAKPTNGWRGTLDNFIVPLFVEFAVTTQALRTIPRAEANVEDREQVKPDRRCV